jgi:hypothetical protein
MCTGQLILRYSSFVISRAITLQAQTVQEYNIYSGGSSGKAMKLM